MAILQSAIAADSSNSLHYVPYKELVILISRLKQNILHPTPERERRLRNSEYERARVEANLNFAQSAFNQLEHGAPHRRTESQMDLAAQRETLELLFDKLEDYRKMEANYDDDESEEDLLSGIIPTPGESMDSRQSSDIQQEEDRPDSIDRGTQPKPTKNAAGEVIPDPPTKDAEAEPIPESTTPSATAVPAAPTQTSSTLRPRSAATPTTTSHSTARAALFANRRKPASPQTTTATAEAILDQQRAEQDAISGAILQMAKALKTNSQSISATLESDKTSLEAAGSSMEKSELGMETAQGRMGSLRRMTEGKGWWGRMMLFAWIYGLMVALILLVFVLPKLRF